jgi:hypothetical protein
MADNYRIAYNIANLNNNKYKLNVTIIDSVDKVVANIDKEVSIEEFNSTIQYSVDEIEAVNKGNEIVKLKTANNIARLLKDDINLAVDKLKLDQLN